MHPDLYRRLATDDTHRLETGTTARPQAATQGIGMLTRVHDRNGGYPNPTSAGFADVAPFQGWVFWDRDDPGRRYALPWADLLLPLRGEK